MTVAGVFEEIEDRERLQRIRARFLEHHPGMDGFMRHPEAVMIRIKTSSFLLLEGLMEAHFEIL